MVSFQADLIVWTACVTPGRLELILSFSIKVMWNGYLVFFFLKSWKKSGNRSDNRKKTRKLQDQIQNTGVSAWIRPNVCYILIFNRHNSDKSSIPIGILPNENDCIRAFHKRRRPKLGIKNLRSNSQAERNSKNRINYLSWPLGWIF